MGIFKRLFKIGQAEANAGIDKIEDPIKMTQQVIRDLSEKLAHAIEAEAKVQAIVVQNKADAKKAGLDADQWRFKALNLHNKIETGVLSKEEGEPYIIIALDNEDKEHEKEKHFTELAAATEVKVKQINDSVVKLKEMIEKTKNDLSTLEARMKTADAMKEVNKELSDFGVDNAKDILKRMEAKVEATENIAQAYSDLDSMNKTSSQKIDEILAKPSSTINDDRLSKFYESIKK